MIRLDRLNQLLTFSNSSKKLINYFESVNEMLMSITIGTLISDLMKIPIDMLITIFVATVIVLWFITKFISYKQKDNN